MIRARRLCTTSAASLLAFALCACAGDADGPNRDDGSDVLPPVDLLRIDEGPARIESATAPDEYSIEIRFTSAFESGSPEEAALSAADTFVLDSSRGHRLTVLTADYDPASHLVRLETERQKLGVTYAMTFKTTTSEALGRLGLMRADIPSADTARLWANNFGAENFPSYEVVAERVAVGEHCVIYLEQGIGAKGIDEAVATFDERIYPIETELYGSAPDQDDNGKILLFGLNGNGYYGGYIFTGNTLTDEEAMTKWEYHSNEMEMVYVNIAAGEFDADVIVAHEFAHLLYAERHGALTPSFAYHNEGLAECAVHAVHDAHPWALPHFMNDPMGQIGKGLSLLDWGWGDYDYYAKAYIFWSYLAAQMGGTEAYGRLFELDGHPDAVAAFAEAELGVDFTTLQLDVLVATWLSTTCAECPQGGRYGFHGMLSFPHGAPPSAPLDTTNLELGPTAGTYLLFPGETTVDYPGDQGGNIRYAGIDWTGKVDLDAPFDVAGGALVVLNGSANPDMPFSSEPSGPIMPPDGGSASGESADGSQPSAPAAIPLAGVRALDRSWMHPPPLVPGQLGSIKRWRDRTSQGALPTAITR